MKLYKIEESADSCNFMYKFLDSFIRTVDVSSNTRTSYQRKIKAFFGWMISTNTKNPRREDIVRYKSDLVKRGLAPSSVSVYLTAIRLFFRYLEAEGKYPNVAAHVKGAKASRGYKKECLTADQVRKVLSVIDQSTEKGKRDFAIVNLLFRTGLRTAELITADVGDIRQELGETVLYIKGKGRDSKDEFVLLTSDALDPIYQYFGTRPGITERSPVFGSLSSNSRGNRLTTRSIRYIVKRYFHAAGLFSPKLTAHSTRHTFATTLYESGASFQEILERLRHSYLNEGTICYIHGIKKEDWNGHVTKQTLLQKEESDVKSTT